MTLDEVIRSLLREVLREEMPELLRAALSGQTAQIPTVATSDYLSTKQAAALAGVRAETIRAWIGSGKLKSKRAGRLLRVGRVDFEHFLDQDRHLSTMDTKRRAREILAGMPRKAS